MYIKIYLIYSLPAFLTKSPLNIPGKILKNLFQRPFLKEPVRMSGLPGGIRIKGKDTHLPNSFQNPISKQVHISG